jgi:nitrous oxidase accessory protein NosD
VNRPDLLRRRDLLGLAALPLAAALRPSAARADDPPPVPVTDPKAIDGDSRFEPDWQERLTLTVGPERADLVGLDDRVIQAALDYVARLGGGTVQLLPGRFVLRNAVSLPSGVRVVGSGEESVVTKVPSVTAPLADDSDWYDGEITLADASGFRVGDGVVLRATNPDNGSNIVIKRTLVARSGNRFKLDRGLRENLWLSGTPTCSSLFPLLTAEHAADVVIEDLTLDGDKANNEHLDGNYAGCIFLQDCNRFTIRRVTARNNNGDGISFQICHDVRVEDCRSLDNADLGLHPGSGSQRPVLLNNRLEGNTIGLFWCWGVRFGLAEGNRIVGNRGSGVSIGHRDTDNVIRNNEIVDSGQVGILFRDDARGQDFWPNRNRVESNRVVNSGGEDGVAIDIQGRTRDVSLLGNEILETRGPATRIGIRIGAEAGAVEESGNRIEGFKAPVLDLRSGG